jgi:polyhydroxyalkanoic acid synthase PhaR subunit
MEERGSRATMDPTDLWRQWYEAGTRAWSDVARGAQEGQMDPHGLYRQWFDGLRDAQERMIGAAPQPMVGDAGVQELWRRWFEATTESWEKSAELGQNVVEIMPRWFRMLEEARDNLLSAGAPPTDPLQFAAQWYNATSVPFSDFVGDVVEREEFLEPASRFLQHYASFYRVYKRNSEEYLKSLQLPVRSDISRVAGLVVNLEDKIDRIEEVLEDFEYTPAKPATADAIDNLEGRLDRVEGKLDKLLAALESSNGGAQTNGSAVEVRATDAARRKAQEMGVDLGEVQGTGTDGEITVKDVRKKGGS